MKNICRITTITLCAALLFTLAGCASTTMVKPSAINVPNNLSTQQVSQAIRKALAHRGWIITDHSNNTYTAKLTSSKWQAIVKVKYSDKNVQLSYGGSKGLGYRNENGKVTISRHWNDWMHYLQQDIQRYMAIQANK